MQKHYSRRGEPRIHFVDETDIVATVAVCDALDIAMATPEYWDKSTDSTLQKRWDHARVRELKRYANVELDRCQQQGPDPADGHIGTFEIADPRDLELLKNGARILLNNEFGVQESIQPYVLEDVGHVIPQLEDIQQL